MSFPRYPEYKNSGVEWLGEVPGHWDVQPFKHQVDRNDGGVWGEDPDGIDDTIVLRSTEQTVDGHWKLDDPAPRKLSESEIRGSLLVENDLLLTKSSGSSLHIGKTTLVTAEVAAMRCCYSNFMQRIRMRPTFLPKLAWYVMNNDLARLQFDLLSNSSTGLANLNATMVGQIVVPVAPLSEQTQIAAFLDRETAKIDALVAEQRRLMALLKEKRQAVISHAVTQGLNPHAPLKPSGIEWLGNVPEHWEVIALKRLIAKDTSISYGIVQPGAPLGEGVPFVQTTNMTKGSFDLEYLQRTTIEIAAQFPRSRLTGGEVILGIRASIGAAHIVPKFLAGANLSRGVARIVPNQAISSRYLVAYFATEAVSQYWQLGKQGSTFNEVSIETVRELTVTVPPIDEQTEIASFLEVELSRFDTLTTEAQRAIDLLQERRTALISAAVTGQIDVRGAL